MHNKEEVYEREIRPLLDQLYDVCEEHDIPFVVSCQVSDETFAGSISVDEKSADQLKIIALILEHGLPTVLLDMAGTQAMSRVPTKMVD